MAMDTAIQNTMNCCDCAKQVAQTMVEEAAGRALQIGDQDVHVTLSFIREIVNKMSAMPGQRILVLVKILTRKRPVEAQGRRGFGMTPLVHGAASGFVLFLG